MKNCLLFIIAAFSILFAQQKSNLYTEIFPVSDLNSKDIQVSFNDFCEYPDICQDKNDNIWIVYSEYLNNRENIILKKINRMAILL